MPSRKVTLEIGGLVAILIVAGIISLIVTSRPLFQHEHKSEERYLQEWLQSTNYYEYSGVVDDILSDLKV